MSRKPTLEEILERFKRKHGDRYDYSMITVAPKDQYEKLPIICREHGVFYQPRYTHERGAGCPECARSNSNNIKRVEEVRDTFIERVKRVHGDKYDLSRVKYVNQNTKIEVVCPIHGPWFTNPYSFYTGHGCPHCGKIRNKEHNKENTRENKVKNGESFILRVKKLYGGRYDYSKVRYENSYTKVEVVCPIHGVFEVFPYDHLRGVGCPICSKENGFEKVRTRAEKKFCEKAKEVWGDFYDLSRVNYKRATVKVEVVCPKHGIFKILPSNFLNGTGCPKCNIRRSYKEVEVFEYVKSIYPDLVESNVKGILGGRSEIDIWIPKLKVGIEFDGLFWHSEGVGISRGIYKKQERANAEGVRLINIFEDEWEYKQGIVKSRLKNILGIQSERVFARKCEVRGIDNVESKRFLDVNHLQGGNAYCLVSYGLFYKGELISVMTFSKPRKGFGNGVQEEGLYELMKFASKIDLTVVGGASKLLSYFVREYDPKEIYSFADRRWSNGNLYERLGFRRVGITPENYFYIIGDRRKNRFGFRKSVLVEQGYDPEKSESQIMKERGVQKIYDAGTFKYSLKFE